ncbi:hypothetical protein [Halobellus rarus]|uniref:DUF7967 domain-containing protein n=1 Tax=Halobellus rarus TaxID=1126237 RepID=A0ABD6CN46_9EURY
MTDTDADADDTDDAANRADDTANRADGPADPDDTVRCWLVERTYTDRGLVDMVYATPDGSHVRRKQLSTTIMRQRGSGTSAAVDVERADLDPVDDEAVRERYAAEVARMREQYDPDDEV